MPALRRLPAPALLLCALALALPSSAPALTAGATVIAPATGSGPATIPVLLARPAAKALGRPVIAVRVRGNRPVRWGSDRLALIQLRPGDRLGLQLAGRSVQRITLRGSGRADTFRYVDRSLSRAGERSERSVADLRAILGGKAVKVDRVRDRLSRLLAELLGLKTDLSTTLNRMRAVQPDGGPRRKAVAAAQAAYARQIAAVRRRAVIAARRTQNAFAELNRGPDLGQSGEAVLVTGPDEAPGVVGTVSSLSNGLLDLLARLGILESSQTGSVIDVVEADETLPPGTGPAPVLPPVLPPAGR
ncbi:MAG TPA: hypothetical protein VIL49_02100 [Capillimicrobium sp.]|jgi:hypothetical protein